MFCTISRAFTLFTLTPIPGLCRFWASHPVTSQDFLWHAIEDARITAEEPAGPIGEAASKEPSETTHAVPSLMPSTRSVQPSSGRMNLSSRMVGSVIALSNLSDSVDHSASSSKSDRVFTGGCRAKAATGPSILKLLAIVLADIGKARSKRQLLITSFRQCRRRR